MRARLNKKILAKSHDKTAPNSLGQNIDVNISSAIKPLLARRMQSLCYLRGNK